MTAKQRYKAQRHAERLAIHMAAYRAATAARGGYGPHVMRPSPPAGPDDYVNIQITVDVAWQGEEEP
jgi:hypothetical protein